MNKRTFIKNLNACRRKDKKLLDLDKVKALPEDVKTDMAQFIIRWRHPLLVEFLTPAIDRSWLTSMGYMCESTSQSTGFVFVHTCEHTIQ